MCGKKIPIINAKRSLGDPPRLIANTQRAKELFGFSPRYSTLKQIITTAWNWHQKS
jgi:UDP-glucose 4-epimerase